MTDATCSTRGREGKTRVIDGELWVSIPGHDAYEVSDRGRVRSLDRKAWNNGGRTPREVFLKGMILAQTTHKGYQYVSLGRAFKVQVHNLVALGFHGPRPDGLVACHNDGDPQNNTPENIRYDTQSANIYDQVRHGTHPMASKTHCKRGHALVDPNLRAKDVGRRQCLSCRHGVRKEVGFPSLPEEVVQRRADEYYCRIMHGIAA